VLFVHPLPPAGHQPSETPIDDPGDDLWNVEVLEGGRDRDQVATRTPDPLPFTCPEDSFEFPTLPSVPLDFLVVTASRATHNPKVGGSNPPPATNLSTL